MAKKEDDDQQIKIWKVERRNYHYKAVSLHETVKRLARKKKNDGRSIKVKPFWIK